MTQKSAPGSPPFRRGRLVRLGSARTGATEHSFRREPTEARLPDVVELGRTLAERIIGTALESHDESLTHWAAQVIDEARGARRLTLFAAPADVERLRAGLKALDFAERELTVSPDPSLPTGEFRLDTELGTLRADVNEALSRLTEAARSILR